jgi:hypothetical protein
MRKRVPAVSFEQKTQDEKLQAYAYQGLPEPVLQGMLDRRSPAL